MLLESMLHLRSWCLSTSNIPGYLVDDLKNFIGMKSRWSKYLMRFIWESR